MPGRYEPVRIKRAGCYFVLFVVYQICGAPLTPDFSIALFNSGDAANVLAPPASDSSRPTRIGRAHPHH
jgi:hypothetical protein